MSRYEAVSSRPEIQCRGERAPVVIRFTEDVRANFRAQNRLDFRRIVSCDDHALIRC
jgi:hypothetical protein